MQVRVPWCKDGLPWFRDEGHRYHLRTELETTPICLADDIRNEGG
jgi:hypothetical protein